MNCTETRQNIDGLHAGELDSVSAHAVRQHLEQCAACRAFERDVTHLRHTLSNEHGLAVPSELVDRTFAGLRRRSRAPWAVAASVVLAVSLVTGVWLNQAQDPVEPAVVAQQEAPLEHTVHLAVNSARALDAVRFRIELPENVEIVGHPNRRALEWTDALAAGRNVLDIPVRINGQPTGTMIARVDHAGGSRELPISLPAVAGKESIQ